MYGYQLEQALGRNSRVGNSNKNMVTAYSQNEGIYRLTAKDTQKTQLRLFGRETAGFTSNTALK